MDNLNEPQKEVDIDGLKKEANSLIFDKRILIVKLERGETDGGENKMKLYDIQKKIKEVNRNILGFMYKKRDEEEDTVKKEKLEANKMNEEQKEEKAKTTSPTGRKPKEDSYTMLIIKALMVKGLKSVDEIVNRVDEQKPGRDKKKIKSQVNSIIYLVKKQEPKRWTQYSWDADNFLLSETQ